MKASGEILSFLGLIGLFCGVVVAVIVAGIHFDRKSKTLLVDLPEEIRTQLMPRRLFGVLEIDSFVILGYVFLITMLPAGRQVAWYDWVTLMFCVLMVAYQIFLALKTMKIRKRLVHQLPEPLAKGLRYGASGHIVSAIFFLLFAIYWGWEFYVPRTD